MPAVTPLDVVRVRLQSRPVSPSSLSGYIPNPTHSASFANLSPRLGVSACCREVFWVNNNAEFCIVAPSGLAVNAHSTSASAAESASECAAEEAQRRTFTSTLDGLRKIARHEGATTLWRGLSPTLAMAIPANVIYFTGYDSLRYSPRSPIAQRIPDGYVPLVAGSLARVLAAMAISPIEMFRTRLQASFSTGRPKAGGTRKLYLETLGGLRELFRTQGFPALWRGLSLTLWRDVPFSGLYWWGYETVRNAMKEARQRRRYASPTDEAERGRDHRQALEGHTATLVDSFVAGAVSGAISSVITTPFDVGKTRRQVFQRAGDSVVVASTGAGGVGQPTSSQRQSMPRFLLQIFRDEGLPGLWKGWAARCLKVAPACAIMISTYEIGKKMARTMNEKRED